MSGTLADLIREAAARLRSGGVPGPERDARLLAARALGIAADRVTLEARRRVTPEDAARLDALIARRLAREPVSQILGEKAFWGRMFAVTADVLTPRPETEELIVVALEAPFERVLDLGCGSGCLGLTVLAERPTATGVLVDVSPPALVVAAANAAALGVEARAEILRSDWYGDVTGRYDLILSNPPYIAEAEMADLAPEVADWEPRLALTPGGDGLADYRRILGGANAHLCDGGRLIVEIGPTQGAAVTRLFRDQGMTGVTVHGDLDGRDRVVSGVRGPERRAERAAERRAQP